MRRTLFICVWVTLFTLEAAPAAETLEYVAIMSRHGVRSPLWTEAQQNSFSTRPWPNFGVPIGYITPRGRTLMEYMGDYYREYFTQAKLLPASGCGVADKFYFWSDVDQRDVETGRALASRMFRGCTVPVYRVPEGESDPLFKHVKPGVAKLDPTAAAKAISERIAGPPEALITRFRPQLEALQKILFGCEVGKTCDAQKIAGKRLLVDPPFGVEPRPGGLADLMGPLRSASEITDMFLLEYTEGMKMADVGWGQVDKAKLLDLMKLYQGYVDLTLQTPYLARAGGSNLMSHILKSLEQAAGGAAVAGSLGKPGDKGLVILGHDSNESQMGGLLGIHWEPQGYMADVRPPGSAMIFELWKDSASGKYSVRSWFVTQTLDQMRDSVPLSLKTPPIRVPLMIPGCGGASCAWDLFRTTVAADITQVFVSNEPIPAIAR